MIIFYVFLAAESDSDIRFSRLDFAAHEFTIFKNNRKLFTVVNSHTFDHL